MQNISKSLGDLIRHLHLLKLIQFVLSTTVAVAQLHIRYVEYCAMCNCASREVQTGMLTLIHLLLLLLNLFFATFSENVAPSFEDPLIIAKNPKVLVVFSLNSVFVDQKKSSMSISA